MKKYILAILLVAGTTWAISSPFPPWVLKLTGDLSVDKSGSVSISSIGRDLTISGTTPALTIGDAGAEDAQLNFDGNTVDFSLGLDDSADKLVLGLGTALGTTERLTFNSADLNILVGDATAADVGFIYDGNAQDYNISLDDSSDDLVIGLGSAAGTTDAIRIDENQDVTIVQDLLPLSTITGDGGASLSGMLQKQTASSATTLTLAQCGESIVGAGVHTVVLPEASTALGCRYSFIGGTDDTVTIDMSDGTDAVVGVMNYVAAGSAGSITLAAGDAFSFTDTGASVVIEAVGNDAWAQVGVANGALTDAN